MNFQHYNNYYRGQPTHTHKNYAQSQDRFGHSSKRAEPIIFWGLNTGQYISHVRVLRELCTIGQPRSKTVGSTAKRLHPFIKLVQTNCERVHVLLAQISMKIRNHLHNIYPKGENGVINTRDPLLEFLLKRGTHNQTVEL